VGDPLNDYFPLWNVKGNPTNGTTPAGVGPNSRILMRFDVAPAITGAPDPALGINTTTNLAPGLDPPLIPFGVSTPPPGIPVRQLSLNETFDAYGRLIQMLGTLMTQPGGGLGQPYSNPATETPIKDKTEVWEIYNTTADVHPMHFHLVNVQVINRQAFSNVNGVPTLKGAARAADANETGWKETVKMFPGEVTRVIMKFSVPQIVTATNTVIPTPTSPRTGGNEYVWHCHILEHEEHDMMRPLVVI
jgi:FtsP/CotA-like multicopper oxidase with cupredoxin domain